MENRQSEIDPQNAEFWDELCGSSLARSLGISEINSKSLRKFDRAYLDYYPYLLRYLQGWELEGSKVLEIGLGYGTLGSYLASRGCEYYGLDLAYGPARMIHYRLAILRQGNLGRGQVGSALALPYSDNCFDRVYSIGCFHHTGNIAQAVSEVYRVLKPGSEAVVMVYNRYSFRQLVQVSMMRIGNLFSPTRNRTNLERNIRGLYDYNVTGEPAPHTDFFSRSQIRRLFGAFSEVQIDIQNFDAYSLGRGMLAIRREWFLNNLARVLGLDLYIVAIK